MISILPGAWSIRSKLVAITAGLIVLAAVLIAAVFIREIRSSAEERTRRFRHDELDKAKRNLVAHVDAAMAIIELNYRNARDPVWLEREFGKDLKTAVDFVMPVIQTHIAEARAGRVTEAVAKKAVLEHISKARYANGAGRFWIMTKDRPYPKMLLDPIQPELQGSVLDDQRFQTLHGRAENFYAAMADIADGEGSGFAFYYNIKAAETLIRTPRLGFVRIIPEWNWVIGTDVNVAGAESILKQDTIRQIKHMRWDEGVGYIWINDMGRPIPRMVMHPTLPRLDGTVLDMPKFNCALGAKKNLFVAFVDVCDREGQGFVDYLWPKPRAGGLSEDQPKISYVRLFKPYNWVVGSGVYIDDIDAAVADDEKTVELQVRRTVNLVLVVLSTSLGVCVFAVLLASKRLLGRPLHAVKTVARDLASGTIPKAINVRGKDELAELGVALNRLIGRMAKVIEQASVVSHAEYKNVVKPESDLDAVGHALSGMTNALREADERKRQLDWVKSGVALLTERLRGEPDVRTLSKNVLNVLADYTGASIGAFYVSEQPGLLQQSATVALLEEYRSGAPLAFGDGLVGQCAQQAAQLAVANVPAHYPRIASGLGNSRPKALLLTPLLYEGRVVGVVELGFPTASKPEFPEFLNAGSEAIAIALNSALNREKRDGTSSAEPAKKPND